MKYINLHIALVAFICILSVNTGFAQVTKTDYFMKSSSLRNGLNPALCPARGYLVPLIPNIGANAQTNSFYLDNFTFKNPGGERVSFMHQSIGADSFLGRLSEDNYASADVNVKLFALGFYKDDVFWNFDMGVRTHADVNIPKPFFGLLKEGFAQGEQTRYDLSDLSATGYSFLELGVSYARPVNQNLIFGTRLKLLGGLADFDLNAKSLSIDAGPDYWKAKSKVTLRGSAPRVWPRYDSKDNLEGFDFSNGFNFSGIGIGLDFGGVYDVRDLVPVLEGLKVSFALNDVVLVYWTRENTIHLQSPETEVIISPNDYSVYKEGQSSLSDILTDAFDDIKEAVNLRGETRKGRFTGLRLNTNIGLEYDLVQDKLYAGLLYSARFGNYFTLSEWTLSLNYRPCNWFAVSTAYSFVHSDFDNIGFALNLTPSRGVNFFLASDYALPHVSSEFIPTTSKALNFQLGISIPFGSKDGFW